MAAADVVYRCFVGNLSRSTDERSLEEAFSSYGEVVETKIIRDKETGASRRAGFVAFAAEQSMRDAIDAMNGKLLDGRTITVEQETTLGSLGGGRSGRT